MSIFSATMGKLLHDLKGWAECTNYLINVSFHLQKGLKSFDKNSAEKIQSKKYQPRRVE